MSRDQTAYIKDVEGAKNGRNKMSMSTTMTEKIADASITAQVKMALLFHRSGSIRNTKVETDKGIVTLGGEALNGADKDLAAKIVTYINGVKSVINNIAIGE